MSHKVFIALTKEDVNLAIKRVTKNDFILTDLSFSIKEGQHIDASFEDISDESLIPQIGEWFQGLKKSNKISFGYVNNFYQSSVTPLAGFFSGIDKIISKLGKDKVIFNLPVSFINKKFTSTYYMAESESIGVHLYNRHDSLLPYIKKYLENKKYKFISEKKKIAFQQSIFNPIRLWGIYFIMFFKNVSLSLKKIPYHGEKLANNYDKVFIIRSVGQAITIIPYLLLTNEKILIVIGSTFTDNAAQEILKSKLKNRENILILQSLKPPLIFILKIYFNVIIKLITRKNYIFRYKGVNLNMLQSLGEMIVMNANLSLYKFQLSNILKKIKADFIFSFEQKSPHAFIDSKISKSLNTPCAQIQFVQQSFNDIPNPVCADFFLCETPKIKQSFEKCFTKGNEKLKYVGSFSGISEDIKKTVEIDNSKLRICIFTGTEYDLNSEFLFSFSKYFTDSKNKVVVKLHPRDSKDYSSIYSKAFYKRTYPEGFRDFVSNFDLAITFPSGVISDLLYTKTPFFVYAPPHQNYQKAEIDFLPPDIEIFFDIDSLFKMMKTPLEDLKKRHEAIIKNFKNDYKIITDFESIQSNLNNLILEKNVILKETS